MLHIRLSSIGKLGVLGIMVATKPYCPILVVVGRRSGPSASAGTNHEGP